MTRKDIIWAGDGSPPWDASTIAMIDGRTMRMPEYPNLKSELWRRYEESDTERHEYGKRQCHSGYNFSLTLQLILDETDDQDITKLAHQALLSVVDFPNAGSISWEMRRFIRGAPKKFIPEFLQLVKQLAEQDKKLSLDMDDFWFSVDTGGSGEFYAREELTKLETRLKGKI